MNRAPRQLFIQLLTLFAICLRLHASSDYSLAFVHIGDSIPSHAYTALQQARYTNEECNIYLLANEKAILQLNASKPAFLANHKICPINISTLALSQVHIAFKTKSKLNNAWRDGFWNHATERFFYLYDFMSQYSVQNLIHLENDNMLYADVGKLLPSFKKLKTEIGAPFEWKLRCIPSFVFMKDAAALQHLIQHILYELEHYTGKEPDVEVNDMCTLSSFGNKFGSKFMTRLPILMPEYSQHYQRREIPFVDGRTSLEFISENYKAFDGYIFDAAALGIFIGGYDPRNVAVPQIGIIHSKSLFDPSKFYFFWDKNENGKKVPYFKFKGKKYKIINLHFHSKNLDGYASFGASQLTFPNKKLRRKSKSYSTSSNS